DSSNYSCAYDATFSILCNIWLDNVSVRTAQFTAMSPDLAALARGFESVLRRDSSLEQVRDTVRYALHSRRPSVFPYGNGGTSIDQLTAALLAGRSYGAAETRCSRCEHVMPGAVEAFVPHVSIVASSEEFGTNWNDGSLSRWFKRHLKRRTFNCPICLAADGRRLRMTRTVSLTSVPPLLFIMVEDERVVLDRLIKLRCADRTAVLRLRGVIYYGAAHFTARIITAGGVMWFHDGLATGKSTVRQGTLQDLTSGKELHFCNGRKAVAAIYYAVH
ncbi:hypothetical protein FB451DRAFT_1051022, partial [Mycena latifolia]